MTPENVRGAWYQWPIALYDRLYRLAHGLDRPAAAVGPAVRLEIRRRRRAIRLADGTVLRPGDRIGVIHLNNERVASLHEDGGSIRTVGLRFRRLFVASLRELARRAEPHGPLADVRAFAATTIYHRGLRRLGFEPAREGSRVWALAVLYQRALLASLHPAGSARLGTAAYTDARRLWISRERLLEGFCRAPASARMNGVRRRGGTLSNARKNRAQSLKS